MTANPADSPKNEKSYILEGQSVSQNALFNSVGIVATVQLDQTGKEADPLQRGSIGSVDNQSVEGGGDTKQLVPNEDESPRSDLLSAGFNFINSILGSGVIGIPYALHQAGFGLGLLLLILVAIVTDYSLILMVRAGHLSGSFSYQGLTEAAFGKPGFIFLSILQFVYPFIAMVSYNVVVGDTVTKVLIRLTGANVQRWAVVGVATLLVTVPLCLYRDIVRLAKISFLSLLCVCLILVAILIRLVTLHGVVPYSPSAFEFANKDIIPAIGIMSFAFMCHHNTFLIYGSIRNPSQNKWDKVTHASVFASFIVSAMFGIAGYATFTGYSQGDLLENYCWDDDMMNVARLLFSVTILLTYPIECFVTREVILNSFFPQDRDCTSDPILARNATHRHIGFTIAIVAITYVISMSTDCLGVVLELNGVLAAVPLAFVLPAICYLRLEPGSLFSRHKIPALGLAIFGLIVAGVGLALLITSFDELDTCSHGKGLPYCFQNTNATSNMLHTVTGL